MTQLYIVHFEHTHYCGGDSHCLVWAKDRDEAVILSEDHMYSTMLDLFGDEFGEDSEDSISVVTGVELAESSSYWKYIQDPVQQAAYYPYIN